MDFLALAQACAPNVAPATLQALVQTESNFQPLAIGIVGPVRLQRPARSVAEAVATAQWLLARGYRIDLGLGQINAANWARTGLPLADAFEPCKNLGVAAQMLSGHYQAARARIAGEQSALHAALSAYNTGSWTQGYANGYVQRVLSHAAAAPARPGPAQRTPGAP